MKNKYLINTMLLSIFLLISILPVFSQHLYFSKESNVRLFSNAPLEDIVAVNKSSNAVLNTQNNEVAVKIEMSRFEFPNKLMQEHFNEHYLETDRFPYATFKGKINKEIDWRKPQNTSVSVSGEMSIHGVQKMLIIDGRLSSDPKNNTIIMDANFKISLADYNIKIPNIILLKISDKVEINTQFKMSSVSNRNLEITSKSR